MHKPIDAAVLLCVLTASVAYADHFAATIVKVRVGKEVLPYGLNNERFAKRVRARITTDESNNITEIRISAKKGKAKSRVIPTKKG